MTAAAAAGDQTPTTVEEILAVVGDDAGIAAVYLEAERAAAKPRSSLVTKLEAIAEPDDLVDVVLLGQSHGAQPGDKVTTTASRAAELVSAGLARYPD
jgi:hypothetical protein